MGFRDAIESTGGVIRFDASWGQGRTAFGGITAAATLRAMRSITDGRTPRTLMVTFIGPTLEMDLTPEVSVIRAGRSVTVARGQLLADGDPRVEVTGIFGDDRESQAIVPPGRRPDGLPAPASLPELPIGPMLPSFLRYFDMRWTSGGFPFTGSGQSRFSGWCRHREPVGWGPEAVCGLTDAWPAPILQLLTRPVPASSVTWTLHFIDVPDPAESGHDPDGWWWFDSETVASGRGYATLQSRLYAPDGRLAAWSEQLATVYG